MSERHIPTPQHIISMGLSIATIFSANAVRSQSKDRQETAQTTNTAERTVTAAERVKKQVEKRYPGEVFEDETAATPAMSSKEGQSGEPIKSPAVASTATPAKGTTALTAANYTFILPTPALIAIGIVVGGLAIFPIVHLLLSSKKVAALSKNSALSKFGDKFQKPQVLESDAFLHSRNFEKLAQIANQAENLNADKFGNTEFTAFFKIKSYIARSMGEYTNLDEIIELLKISIDTQNSFATIDSTESRHCSSSQQELYKFVNTLYEQNLDHDTFKERVDVKLQEILPKLKTDEGREVLQTYAKEVAKVARHPLAIKLLLSFKKYNLADYSILRSVSNTVNLLDGEDLLNLDGLMVLVMVKYEVFEKLGPIVGVAEEHNRPETYSKMLQYIGLKSRHEGSYEKFQEFLITLKQWEISYKTVCNVREKYDAKEYRLPKDFTAEVPGAALYRKYKDSFHLITSATLTPPQSSAATPVVEPTAAAVATTPLPVESIDPALAESLDAATDFDLIVAAEPDVQIPVPVTAIDPATLTGTRSSQ